MSKKIIMTKESHGFTIYLAEEKYEQGEPNATFKVIQCLWIDSDAVTSPNVFIAFNTLLKLIEELRK